MIQNYLMQMCTYIYIVKAKNNPHFSHFPHPATEFQAVTKLPAQGNPHWNPHVTHTLAAPRA